MRSERKSEAKAKRFGMRCCFSREARVNINIERINSWLGVVWRKWERWDGGRLKWFGKKVAGRAGVGK